MEDAAAPVGSVDTGVIIAHHPGTVATTMGTGIHQPLWIDPCSWQTTIHIATTMKSLIHLTIIYNNFLFFLKHKYNEKIWRW